MSKVLLNKQMLPDNDCFGCGHLNPHGLKIEIWKESADRGRLLGKFYPPEHMIGFPGITHGGAIYTALDCMAAWVPTALRRQTKAIWILRSASMTYHRPAHQGHALFLSAHIEEESEPWAPMVVNARAEDRDGNLLSKGKFKVIPLPPKKFLEVAGINEIPVNYRNILNDPD